MKRPDAEWRELLTAHGYHSSDDPVPLAISRVIEKGKVDLRALEDALLHLPLRHSIHRSDRVKRVRQSLVPPLSDVWRQALLESRFASPLLILDEAHHLKNPATALASLFVDSEAAADASVLQGALKNRFERMLFLTATPFQLGHNELLNVIGRFRGIRWRVGNPSMSLEEFEQHHQALRAALDDAQRSSLTLDERWGSLAVEDLPQGTQIGPESWWSAACQNRSALSERLQSVMKLFDLCREKMSAAELLLRPWVIRHLRSRQFEGIHVQRRRARPGASIREGGAEGHGIAIGQEAILPFLLVARSQAVAMAAGAGQLASGIKRLTFVEGLASSYEAYLKTRAAVTEGEAEILDEDAASATDETHSELLLDRYQRELRIALPKERAYAKHPKIAATVEQVRHLWRLGEKVLVFCHFRATGRALETHISKALDDEVIARAKHEMKCGEVEARERLKALGEAFDPDRPAGKALDLEVDQLLAPITSFTPLDRVEITEVIRRFVRTDSFLVRFFPLDDRSPVDQLQLGLERVDESGLSLRAKLRQFVKFIEERKEERSEYLASLHRLRTGRNVRRATGETDPDERRRLLLSFNTPFFPEVLIASSVLAEGVDLHLECRYVIHHDLSWNPSTLEQRTGRVDRIGAKAERAQRPIHVFLPYLGGTQDEKMFRVVRDRERWFQVLMGEKYEFDERSKDRLAERVPLPEEAAKA
ncbi:MAG: DEAD/DEAH box helicase, partial [Acidobacteriota bacterium]